MTYRELRVPLVRLVTAVVFVAAAAFLRTQPVHAEFHYGGSCEEQEIEWGCDYWQDDEVIGCSDYQDCQEFPWSEGHVDLCFCNGPGICGWWPGGCDR